MNHELVQQTLAKVFAKIRALPEGAVEAEIMSRIHGPYAEILRASGHFGALVEEHQAYTDAQTLGVGLAYVRPMSASENDSGLLHKKEAYAVEASLDSWLYVAVDPANREYVIIDSGDNLWLTMMAA